MGPTWRPCEEEAGHQITGSITVASVRFLRRSYAVRVFCVYMALLPHSIRALSICARSAILTAPLALRNAASVARMLEKGLLRDISVIFEDFIVKDRNGIVYLTGQGDVL